MVKQLDARVPAEFVEEFVGIAQGFVTPFTRFMKKLKGPAYKAPRFQNIKLSEEDDTTQQSQHVGNIREHDIIDMTQPSQHVSQPPTVASASRPSKLTSRRMKEEKWSITKSLSMTKKSKIYEEWGWGMERNVKITGLAPAGCNLTDAAMLSLAPGQWIDDRIIYSYMVFTLTWYLLLLYYNC